jgi:hypothetical protein
MLQPDSRLLPVGSDIHCLVGLYGCLSGKSDG